MFFRLHVLVYDIEGQRLPYPVAVEESIPALCPLPVLKYNDRMVISHITKEKVYLQRVIDETFIVDLADQLTELYESGDQEKVVIEEGQFYAAKSGQFGSWYRFVFLSFGFVEMYMYKHASCLVCKREYRKIF